MKLVLESTGWIRNDDILSKMEGGTDAYTCTITTWQVEANNTRFKLLEDTLIAVIRPKPKWISLRLWLSMVRFFVCFERQAKSGERT